MLNGRRRVLLVLADSPWPPTSGGQIRNTQLHRALGSSADVRSLVFRLRDPVDPAQLPHGTQVVDRPLPAPGRDRIAVRARGLVGRRHPFLQHLVETGSPAVLAETLAREPAEVVVLTYPCFGPFLEAARAAGARVVVDIGEARGPIARQRLRESPRVGPWMRALGDLLVASRMERQTARADEVWVSSPAEAERLPRQVVQRLRVIPNTLDVNRYIRYAVPDRLPPRVGFVGSFDYPPNALAAARLVDRILPRLRETRPDARAIIIGRHPGPSLIKRSRAAVAWELRADALDPMAELAEAGVLVVPLTAGGGTKYKILEAAASGVPIVTTRVGLQGLDFVPREDLLVADTDDEIAAAVLSLWTEPGLAARLAEHAAGHVRRFYSQGALDAAVTGALDDVLSRQTPSIANRTAT